MCPVPIPLGPLPLIEEAGSSFIVYTEAMSWAGGRRFFIVFVGGSIIIAVLALIIIPVVYEAPSCSDHKQNQDELGVDCGGSCTYLCTADQQAPVVRFTKAIPVTEGRTDVLAYVDNANVAAGAKDVPYTITLYAGDRTILKTSTGKLDLLPSALTPVYVPNFYSGRGVGAQAFLTINAQEVRWFAMAKPPVLPTVGKWDVGGTVDNPRITATITNTSTINFVRLPVIVAVFDSADNVFAASQTLLSALDGLSTAPITFTWTTPFSKLPARVEIVPLITFSP